MNKGKKILSLALAGLCGAGVVGTAAGCKKVANDPNTLQISITSAGYGTEWLDAEIKLFKEQAWVKEKYPKLNILKPAHTTSGEFAFTEIISGGTSFDLFFPTASAANYYQQSSYFADMTDVYEGAIPGESDFDGTPGKQLKDKMEPSIYSEQDIVNYADTSKSMYLGVPWVNGTMGIFYNKTKLDQYLPDNTLPRTTDEMVAMVDRLSDLLPKGDAPMIFTSSINYMKWILPIWWAQYEGVDGYENYWNGVVWNEDEQDYEYSDAIFAQQGRLETLKVLESLTDRSTGYAHSMCVGKDFTLVQGNFVNGTAGVFMLNGDWMRLESEIYFKNDQEISILKTPVVSAIRNKCPSIPDDATLAKVVQHVDDGHDYQTAAADVTGLKEDDFNRIYEARNVYYHNEGHNAYIPEYATAKELAKDFVRFLATDIGINCFMKETGGFRTAYKYDVETEDPALYNSFSKYSRDGISYFMDAVEADAVMPSYTSFRLNYYGGLAIFAMTMGIDAQFVSAEGLSAQAIYDADVKAFAGTGKFENILTSAKLR